MVEPNQQFAEEGHYWVMWQNVAECKTEILSQKMK
jgi:hypothetical protein